MDERRCEDCHARIGHVAQRVDRMESRMDALEHEHERHDNAFLRHMEKEESAFDSFYTELRSIRDQIASLVTSALRDRSALEKDIAKDLQQRDERLQQRDEQLQQRFVTKNEVRVGWAVAVAVLAGALWFFPYMQERQSDANLDKIADRLVKELKK